MMRWFRLHHFAAQTGLKIWAQEPLGQMFNALVLAIALALPWAFIQGLNALAPAMGRNVGTPQVSLFFKPNTGADVVKTAAIRLQRDFDVQSVQIIPPDKALETLRQISQTQDLAAALDSNPLPYTVVATLNIQADTRTQSLNQKIDTWREFKGVEHVQYDAQWVQKLHSVIHSARLLGLALAGLVAAMVLVVSFNTVRLQLAKRHQELHVQKCFGATDRELARPTLWWALSLAVAAFVLAYGFMHVAMAMADDAVGPWIRQFDSGFGFAHSPASTTLALLGGWVALVCVGAWASVRSTLMKEFN